MPICFKLGNFESSRYKSFIRNMVYICFLPVCNWFVDSFYIDFQRKEAFNFNEVQYIGLFFYGLCFWYQILKCACINTRSYAFFLCILIEFYHCKCYIWVNCCTLYESKGFILFVLHKVINCSTYWSAIFPFLLKMSCPCSFSLRWSIVFGPHVNYTQPWLLHHYNNYWNQVVLFIFDKMFWLF